MRKWIPIIILASGQFVMTLDSSVMNVSITQISADLNTSIQGIQAAITLYTLVMAAFMLSGAKLGDIHGRNRIFAIGLMVYGVGSLLTALSPSLPVLLVGWSGIEGLGAVMVIPAIAALTAANYEGGDRALAYALIGGITAIAVAAGPLIGGWVTTNAQLALGVRRGDGGSDRDPARPRADPPGASCREAAQDGPRRRGALCVRPRPDRLRHPDEQQVGVRRADWGTDDLRDGNHATRVLGGALPDPGGPGGARPDSSAGSSASTASGVTASSTRPCCASSGFAPGSTTLLGQQLVLMGVFFVIPVYLQTVVGFDAFETGKRLLPLSVAMLVFAMAGPKIAAAGRRGRWLRWAWWRSASGRR